MVTDEQISKKISSILPKLDERLGRLYLASEALVLGRGGKQRIAKLAGVSRVRIDRGIAEINEATVPGTGIRKAGGGRKKKTDESSELLPALEFIVSAHTRGDPMNPLLWTNKSLRNIEKSLKAKGFNVSYVTVGELLKTLGYSLQANRKTDEGASVEDRDKQFEYINSSASAFMGANDPVISVDCKKKGSDRQFKK